MSTSSTPASIVATVSSEHAMTQVVTGHLMNDRVLTNTP